MTIQDIKDWLGKIENKDLSYSEEVRSKEHPDTLAQFKHDEELRMHWSVLRAIADGKCEDPQECARLALESSKINFKRFYPGYTIWKEDVQKEL